MAHSFVRTPDPIYVKDRDEAKKWAAYYETCDAVGFDTETTGLRIVKDRIKFFSFADAEIGSIIENAESIPNVNRAIKKNIPNIAAANGSSEIAVG